MLGALRRFARSFLALFALFGRVDISSLRWDLGPRHFLKVESRVRVPGLRISFSNRANSHDFVQLGFSVVSHKFLKLFVLIFDGLSRCEIDERDTPLFGGTELCHIRFVKDRVLLSRHIEGEGCVSRFH